MLDALAPGTPELLRARLVHHLTSQSTSQQDAAELRRLAGTAAPTLRETDPTSAISDEAVAMLAAMWTGHADELAWRSAAVHGQLDALGDRDLARRPELAYVVGMTDLLTEDLAAARRTVDLGAAALRTGGDETAFVPFTGLAAMVAVAGSDARTGRRYAAATEEAARLNGTATGIAQALWLRAALAALDGDLEDAARAQAEWPRVAEALGDIQHVRSGHLHLTIALGADDPERAAAELCRWAGPDFDAIEPEFSVRVVIPAYVRARVALGDRVEAERATALAEARAAVLGVPVALGAAKLCRAELALTATPPDPVAALDAAQEASALAASRGFAVTQFDADLTAARALALLGRREDAVALLRAAADRASAGGAWALRDSAARELRRLGSRLPAVLRARGEEGELTDRERQIAELVAAGRTNKEVGRLLFLSPKTVEHSLSRIYAKLAVRGRGELAAALAATLDAG
ncbi:MAG: helix-turn-helix transcriptional regulator, partial [Solirubrobacteraceae bacterium]|nr:helix-turn-helix transcriptional regulator [Patulibacter sp.]